MTFINENISRKVLASLLAATISATSAPGACAQNQQAAVAQPADPAAAEDEDSSWPRVFSEGNLDISVYQPQVDSWQGDTIEARAAVAVQQAGAAQPKFGVIWIKAHSTVDRQSGLVALDNVEISKANFPSETAGSDAFLTALRKNVPAQVPDISLASLQASLAVSEAEAGANTTIQLRNDPPQIIFSQTPALLVRIDGKPVLRKVSGSALLRVINTSALILLDEKTGTYYLRALKHWYSAKQLADAPQGAAAWSRVDKPPAALGSVLKGIGNGAATFDQPPADIADAIANGASPAIHVSTTPAELIQTRGEPAYVPIPDTGLLYVKNTSSHFIVDENAQDYYVLISGRWFRTKSLQDGPWQFVDSKALPADFAKIPDNHPQGEVLASVAGTPQAKEALIDNSIPQMATVSRTKTKPTVRYDGAPQLRPIEGTTLQYVLNASEPVIKATDGKFYAVEKGVWFVAASVNGPWSVATEIPAEIYAIPASSPLHYVTYVRVYSSTPSEVIVGYTPGYYGTVVAPGGVVVYGTGYAYDPWIGDVWYPAPATYGFGAGFAWGAVTGFVFGAVASSAWYGGAWGPGPWGWHGWGGNTVIINNFNQFNFNNTNIYNRWQNNAVHTRFQNRIANFNDRLSPQQRQNLADRARQRVGNMTPQQRQGLRDRAGDIAKQRGALQNRPNNLFAGHDGQVYRRGARGWEAHDGRTWNPAGGDIGNRLNREQGARLHGNSIQNFRNAGGFHGGGFAGGRSFGSFRAGGLGGSFHGGGFHGGGFRHR